MVACSTGSGNMWGVWLLNFYTQECHSHFQCNDHQKQIRGIDWQEDDMGFTSCSEDGNVFFYDLA